MTTNKDIKCSECVDKASMPCDCDPFKHGTTAFDAMRQTLEYYRDECSGNEPSISAFHRMIDQALEKAGRIEQSEPVAHVEKQEDDSLRVIWDRVGVVWDGDSLYAHQPISRVAELEERCNWLDDAHTYEYVRADRLEAQLSAIQKAVEDARACSPKHEGTLFSYYMIGEPDIKAILDAVKGTQEENKDD